MNLFTAIIAIVLLLVIYVVIKRRGASNNVRPDERRKISPKATAKYHAVSLKFAPSACEAAKKMEGRRFLSSAAPRIPLPECDVLECKCRFVHYTDRRSGEDRRNPYGQGFGNSGSGTFEEEKRKRRERREEPPDDIFS